MSALLGHYGVPLILTSDDGVTTLMTDDEAAAVMQSHVDGLRANGYHHTDVLHSEVSVLNSVSALYRCDLVPSQRRWRGIRLPHSHFSGYRRRCRVTDCRARHSGAIARAARARSARRRRAQQAWRDPARRPWIPVPRPSFRNRDAADRLAISSISLLAKRVPRQAELFDEGDRDRQGARLPRRFEDELAVVAGQRLVVERCAGHSRCTPIIESRVTIPASCSSDMSPVPSGRIGNTR